jgi:hypothetical protein
MFRGRIWVWSRDSGLPACSVTTSPAAVLSATGSSCEPRTERSCEIGWTVATDEALKDVVASGKANSEEDRDLTVKSRRHRP